MQRRLPKSLLCCLALGLTSCASARNEPTAAAPAGTVPEATTASTKATMFITASRGPSYNSIGGLASESTVIVVAQATGKTSPAPTAAAFDPATDVEVVVKRVFKGEAAAGQILKIRRLGDATVRMEDATPFEGGADYLLFLRPYDVPALGTTTNEFLVVGYDAGKFDVKGNRIIRTDRQSPDMPAEFSETDVAQAVK